MSTDHPPEADDGRLALPRMTTPTWEMELLISGATVFSLLQVPELLDSAFYAWYPRLDQSATGMVMLPYIYLLSAVWALIITFVLHLATRARWVALVGLGSVYPDGIEWSRLRFGPDYLKALQERYPSLAATIERADNTASRVFGFGVAFAMLILAPLIVASVLSLITLVIHKTIEGSVDWPNLWLVVSGIAFGPFLLVMTIDRYWPRPARADGRRTLSQRVLGFYMASGFSSFSNYPMLLFSSRVGQHSSSGILIVAMMMLLAGVFGRMVAREDLFHLDGYAMLPSTIEARGHVLDPRSYADQRDGRVSMAPAPFIQSEVIEGDYVRLFVPHLPTRDRPLMDAFCPPALPDFDGPREDELGKRAHDEAKAAALLACVARIYRIAIDGVAVEAPRFDLATDGDQGLRGFVTRIDVRELPRGRHELLIERMLVPPKDGSEETEHAKAPWMRRIPFWR